MQNRNRNTDEKQTIGEKQKCRIVSWCRKMKKWKKEIEIDNKNRNEYKK